MQPILSKYAAVCVRCPGYGTRYSGLLGCVWSCLTRNLASPSSVGPGASASSRSGCRCSSGGCGVSRCQLPGVLQTRHKAPKASVASQEGVLGCPLPSYTATRGPGWHWANQSLSGPRSHCLALPFPCLCPWACHVFCVTRVGIRSPQPGMLPYPRKGEDVSASG